MDEDGNIVYKLGVLAETDDVFLPIVLTLDSDDDIRQEYVSLFQYIPLYKGATESYRYYTVDNIPVLEINSLSRVYPEDNSIEEFIDDAKKVKGVDNLIIDIRNNMGGSILYVDEWYKGFTGHKLKKDIVGVGLYTQTSIALSKNKFETKENEKEEIKTKCIDLISEYESKDYFPGWSPIEYDGSDKIANNTNIYILTDKNTSSAAEFLAHYLRKLDNVTLVGTNTNGCFLTGNCNSAHLPNSHIPLHISQKLYMCTDFTNIDGLGIFPELWVKPEQALDRVIKHINNNK